MKSKIVLSFFWQSKCTRSYKLCSYKKKLRDIQQEREGTSLNYFKVYFNYIEQLSRSLLLYLGFLCLSWSISTILVYISASQSISGNLGLSRSILVYISLFRTISDYLGLSCTISDYLRLSRTISVYLGLYRSISDLGLSRTILYYLILSRTIWDYMGLSGTI